MPEELIVNRMYRVENLESRRITYALITHFWVGISGRDYAVVMFVPQGGDALQRGDYERHDNLWELIPESFKLEDFICQKS